MAQNGPWGLKNSNIFWGRPPRPPRGRERPPSHLALRAKMAALLPSLVPAIDTFVPATSNLNKNPGKCKQQHNKWEIFFSGTDGCEVLRTNSFRDSGIFDFVVVERVKY